MPATLLAQKFRTGSVDNRSGAEFHPIPLGDGIPAAFTLLACCGREARSGCETARAWTIRQASRGLRHSRRQREDGKPRPGFSAGSAVGTGEPRTATMLGSSRVQQRFSQRRSPDFELRDGLALGSLDQRDVAGRQSGERHPGEEFRSATQLVHQRPAGARGDEYLPAAGRLADADRNPCRAGRFRNGGAHA